MPNIVEFAAKFLVGSPCEPWVNALLFLLFAAAVASATFTLLLGRGWRQAIVEFVKSASEKLEGQKGYAPEAERFRLRIAPYVELVGTSFFAFVGLYSTVVVGLATALTLGRARAWAAFLGLLWAMVSAVYMRINLQDASWAYHKLKLRRSARLTSVRDR
jgi:hypothetical protein